MLDANARANEINKENKKTKQQKEKLRPYKCEDCGNYHLTKMKKHDYRYKYDVKYRNVVNEKSMIRKESEYWDKRFGIC